MSEVIYKIPADASNYKGEFIVFFSEEENPNVLYHSIVAEEAYRRAQEIKEKIGKEPVVIRISDSDASSVIAHMNRTHF
jgi:tRNA threonylcarbamoyladenosine modification (KEOPS) complex  Pcc1 subunit